MGKASSSSIFTKQLRKILKSIIPSPTAVMKWLFFVIFDTLRFFCCGEALVVTLVGAWFLFVQEGFTPLHMVCQNGHGKIVEMLKEAGVNLEVKSEVSCRWGKPLCPSAYDSERFLVALAPCQELCQLLLRHRCFFGQKLLF